MNYVRRQSDTQRYRFPTHTNDLIFDRSEAAASESFFVVLAPGEAPPRHRHDDAEQVFYVLEGRGRLFLGDHDEEHPVQPGDVVLIPAGAWHSIRAEGGSLRYLAVDCFLPGGTRREKTWDEHARAMCRERGWDYDAVTGGGRGKGK